MDGFIEYMIKQKKSKITLIKCIAISFAAVLISFIITFITFFVFPQIINTLPLIILAIFYFDYKICTSFNIEYEYILTNGELDIDRITHKRKRKRLLTVHSKTFTAFAKVGSKTYENEENSDFAKVIKANANSDSYDDYFAIFYINGQKTKLIFNPTKKMIDAFKIYAPRVVKDVE